MAIIDTLNPFPLTDDETDIDARIRRRAYELWDAAGRPDGTAQEHWLAAERELAQEGKELPGSG